MLKWLAIALLLLLALLQYRLWFGDGGVQELRQIRERVAALDEANKPLRDRNARLAAEVVDLKTGLDAIEERARSDIGMVRTDEHFYWVPGAVLEASGFAGERTAASPAAEGAAMSESLWLVVPAAGQGRRMGAARPKQYLPLAGRPVMAHTLARLHAALPEARLCLCLDPDDAHFDPAWVPFADWRRVAGGAERVDSVANALAAIAGEAAQDDLVLVHDVARPCVTPADLERLCEALRGDPAGGLLAAPVADTMKRDDGAGRVAATEPRAGLWHALTPRGFASGCCAVPWRRRPRPGLGDRRGLGGGIAGTGAAAGSRAPRQPQDHPSRRPGAGRADPGCPVRRPHHPPGPRRNAARPAEALTCCESATVSTCTASATATT